MSYLSLYNGRPSGREKSRVLSGEGDHSEWRLLPDQIVMEHGHHEALQLRRHVVRILPPRKEKGERRKEEKGWRGDTKGDTKGDT